MQVPAPLLRVGCFGPAVSGIVKVDALAEHVLHSLLFANVAAISLKALLL